MRKFLLLLGSCMAVVAFLGTGSAFALVYDQCDGSPYNNNFAVHDAKIDTVDSHKEGYISGSRSSGIACGTDISLFGGNDTFVRFIRVDLPEGTFIRGTSDLPIGSVTGHGQVDLLEKIAGPKRDYDNPVTTRVAGYGTNKYICPESEATSCWENNVSGIGTSYTWKRLKPNPSFPGQEQLVIGPVMVGTIEVNAGMVGIDFLDLCTYIGDPGQPDCGGQGDPVQGRNGLSSIGADGCRRGTGEKGLYRLEVENRNGDTTSATTCVTWLPANSGFDFTGQFPFPLPAR